MRREFLELPLAAAPGEPGIRKKLREKRLAQYQGRVAPTYLVFERLNGYVAERYLTRLFKRSEATIFLWRMTRGLPFVEIPGDSRCSVRYNLVKVAEWARRNRIKLHPVQVVSPDGKNAVAG